jgi:hypothetical protein
VLDARLVGLWSDADLYQGSMEEAVVVFRPDGSGWTYWARDGGVFSVHRFGWRTAATSRLHLRFRQRRSGTWTVRGHEVRHQVDRQHAHDSELALAYTINAGQDLFGNPATLLELDQPLIVGTVGDRFALKHNNTHIEDPTISGALPRGWR